MPTSADQQLATYRYWIAEVEKAKKREQDYRKDANDIVKLYEAGKRETHQFNILYSNTETLSPALYNSLPRPEVKPKDKKTKDPIVIHSARVAQRLLEAMLDTGHEDDTTLDSVFKQAVTEGLVPGRGVAWLRYDAEIKEEDDEQGNSVPTSVEAEEVCVDELPWDRFLHGYAKKWSKVPWVAALWYMDKGELKENFGEDVFAGGEFKPTAMETEDESGKAKYDTTEDESTKPLMACVYEIWDKKSRKVYFVSESFPGRVLKEEDDPLGLTGFFPCPEPLSFFRKISSLTPVPLYYLYDEQAEELNDVTYRIRKIIKSLKVRGAYDAALEEGFSRLKDCQDGELIGLPNVASLGNGQGTNIANAIWMMPFKEQVLALQQLYAQREQVKQVIYEITGVSDILRGASQASETATAQNIKNQWGTLRLKRAQATVAVFCRNTLRIMLEIAVTKFSSETVRGMTQTTYPSRKQQEMARTQVMLQQQTAMPGQPPSPPPPELQELLSLPALEDLLDALRNDLSRCYSIDIETNSTVDAEATEDKKDFSELLNAISQFMNGVAPLIESGVMEMGAASSILVSIVRRFRLGDEVEDQIRAMGSQQKKGDDGEAAKAQAELQKGQMELQKIQASTQAEMQKGQMQLQLEQEKLQLERERMAMERQKMQMDFAYAEREHQMKLQLLQSQTQSKLLLSQQKEKQKANKPGEV